MNISWKTTATLTATVAVLLLYGIYYAQYILTGENTFAVQFRIIMYAALVAWVTVASLFTAWYYTVGKTKLETLSESERIMKRFKLIESKDMPKLNEQTLDSMENLKKVADKYNTIIFHTKTALTGDVFFTTANNITYQYVTNKESQ